MCPTVACMTARGDLMELVCHAFCRTPPLSASVRSWFHLVRLQQAEQDVCGSGATGGACGFAPPAGDPNDRVIEATDRLMVATQQGSYRLERDHGGRAAVHVSDGVTTWLPTFSGVFHTGPSDPDGFPARNLLDPSWLAGYEWDTPSPAIHNDWDIVVMHARMAEAPLSASGGVNRDTRSVIRQRPPAEVDVLIDAEYGFLHRMTGLIDSQPFVVEELLDVVLDPPLDVSAFRVDPPRIRVIDPPEWER